MNTGAEAVETAIKTARKWGYEVKGVPADEAVIIVVRRATSTAAPPRSSASPPTPTRAARLRPVHARASGSCRTATPTALAAAMDDRRGRRARRADPGRGRRGRAAAGLPGRGPRAVHARTASLMIADEIQSGLGRTGTTFACEHEGVVPDMYLLGKALGGGIVPVSAVVVDRATCSACSSPGQHGSTFGGNPLACAVGREVIAMLRDRRVPGAVRQARRAPARPAVARCPPPRCARCAAAGLWAGRRVHRAGPAGRSCERLAARGVLAKDTHGTDDPARAAADHQRSRPGLGPRPDRGGGPLAAGQAAVAAGVVQQGTGAG